MKQSAHFPPISFGDNPENYTTQISHQLVYQFECMYENILLLSIGKD
jgi:hypothetical protein